MIRLPSRLVAYFLRCQAGGAAITFGVAAVPLVMAAGGAVDFSRATVERAEMQGATDAAALAAVLARKVTDDQRKAVAARYFDTTDTVATTFTGPTLTVTVNATRPMKTTLLAVAGMKTLDIKTTATAIRSTNGPPACAVALNKTVSGAITFQGSTTFMAPNCAMYSNSSSPTAINIQGAASVTTGGYCAVGGIYGPTSMENQFTTGCAVQDDPYKAAIQPAAGKCINPPTMKPGISVTLSPGTYCSGLDLKGSVTLSPGPYVIQNGNFTVNSNTDVSGSGVTFFLTGNNAGFKLNGGGVINLTAPTSGDQKGMLIMQNPTSNAGADNTLNGDANMKLLGAIYTPTQSITVNGNAGFGQSSAFMPLVADTLKFSGSSTLNLDTTVMKPAGDLPRVENGARLIN